MKILALADTPSMYYWDFFEAKKLEGIDLIISCGDLDAQYLSFLATYAKVPLFYVHGNHDENYKLEAPEGCISIEDKVVSYHGLRIMGLGGSMRYKKTGSFQYTEAQMQRRLRKLRWKGKLWSGLDILVTHAPSFAFSEAKDLCHQGFTSFDMIRQRYQPSLHVHGHTHLTYGRQYQRSREVENTLIVNAYESSLLEYQEGKWTCLSHRS